MEIKNNDDNLYARFNDMLERKYFFLVIFLIIINLVSCGAEMGSVVITKPDEYRQTYEAKEAIILKAIAGVFRDKKMGNNVTINQEKQTVETDYIAQGDWRTKSMARVRKINWKESEVVLSVFTEKKTEKGWEMRRLLEKNQYVNIFDTIELRIYEEMSKIE
jgi:hypothetical protein